MKKVLVLFCCFFALSLPALAEEDTAAVQGVDHSDWSLILGAVVLERQTILEIANNQTSKSRTLREPRMKKGMDINYVPYKLIKREFDQILFVLEIYIQKMWEVEVSKLNRDAQLAYWLNLRNALVLHTIFFHTPIGENNLKDLYYGTNTKASEWTTKKVWVEWKLLSIRDIEEIISSGWPDPRVLYGLFYGAKGGPFLMNQAFTGENVYALLEQNCRQYINASNTINVSRKKGLVVPLVYEWHSDLFGGGEAILRHLREYAGKKLGKKLARASASQITYTFDWELNDIPTRIGGFNFSQMYLSFNLRGTCNNLGSANCGLNSFMGDQTVQPRGR